MFISVSDWYFFSSDCSFVVTIQIYYDPPSLVSRSSFGFTMKAENCPNPEPYRNSVDNTHLSVSLKLFEGMAYLVSSSFIIGP